MNALALGMAYALVALGFVLALNASGAVNFAHGDLVVLGGVWLLLERTQIGRRRRAVAADRQMARARRRARWPASRGCCSAISSSSRRPRVPATC